MACCKDGPPGNGHEAQERRGQVTRLSGKRPSASHLCNRARERERAAAVTVVKAPATDATAMPAAAAEAPSDEPSAASSPAGGLFQHLRGGDR